MALKDFRDTNKSITIMRKGEDSSYKWMLDEGFNPSDYTFACEGRLSEISELPDFTFIVSTTLEDGIRYATVFFDRSQLTSWIRQSKVYWKLIATTVATPTKAKVIQYGEVWLM